MCSKVSYSVYVCGIFGCGSLYLFYCAQIIKTAETTTSLMKAHASLYSSLKVWATNFTDATEYKSNHKVQGKGFLKEENHKKGFLSLGIV